MRAGRARLFYAALKLADAFRRYRHAPAEAPDRIPETCGCGISVIIPERANPTVLAECVGKAEIACRELSEPSEIIVVASGSPVSLYQGLIEEYPRVRWDHSGKPLWYAAAVRRGLETARYDWVYLLNSDTMLDALALKSLLPWRSRQVFAVASQVFFPDPGKRREETGWTLFRATGGPIEIRDEVPDDAISVRGTFYAGGGASLFRCDLLKQLTHGSSVYAPFYWEDVEWGARAWRMGYHSLYCPASRVWHLHRTTNRLFFTETEIDRILVRNRFVFHFRNGPPLTSFRDFVRTMHPLDPKSLGELFTFSRMARIAFGRFQNCRLPGPIEFEHTWEMRYGFT